VAQAPWRPRLLLQAIHNSYVRPDIVVDISDFWEQKLADLTAFRSQFYHPEYATDEVGTYIFSPDCCFGGGLGQQFSERRVMISSAAQLLVKRPRLFAPRLTGGCAHALL